MQTARGVYSSVLGPNSRSRVPSRKSCRFIKAETTHLEGSHMKGKRGTKLPENFKGGSGFADNIQHVSQCFTTGRRFWSIVSGNPTV